MMIGEIDFKTTLYDEYVNFEFLSFVFFSIFMLLMPIVVVNLLVGLAVEDIHACKRNASLEKRRLQVDLMLEFTMSSESKYSWSPFSLPVPDSTTLIIPKNQGFIKKMWDSAWKLTEHDIKSGLKPEKDRIFKLERKLNKLRKYMKKQMETTREILERLK
ncbi:transient receptor potential cation channel subfamily A member 1-like [Ruditapes philippinarum]|uniref:transient receptor potential cation channel subfamily A member 1-like n=1 Tax=Ruditapes philippinarum TaxID=129788 RepID=UPI00295B0A5D|nr:transient receptor potential cation channel subfamily A member 1-like [Ruditapes philippinarum]